MKKKWISLIMKNLLIISLSVATMMKYSKKKVMILLSMEMMMLTMIFMFTEKLSENHTKCSTLIIMMIIMVTESILGTTIMIFHSRESNKMSSLSFKSM